MPESFTEEVPEKRVRRLQIEGLVKQLKNAPIETEQDIVDALVLCHQLEDAITGAANVPGLYTQEEINLLHDRRLAAERERLIRKREGETAEDLRTPERSRAALEILKDLSNPNTAK